MASVKKTTLLKNYRGGGIPMNIAQEIYESIQELYQEIIKVDLKTGKATILHSITDPSDRGKECIWDSQLEKYMKNKIQPSDHERM